MIDIKGAATIIILFFIRTWAKHFGAARVMRVRTNNPPESSGHAAPAGFAELEAVCGMLLYAAIVIVQLRNFGGKTEQAEAACGFSTLQRYKITLRLLLQSQSTLDMGVLQSEFHPGGGGGGGANFRRYKDVL